MEKQIDDKLPDDLFFNTKKMFPQNHWSIKTLEFYNNIYEIMNSSKPIMSYKNYATQ